MHRAVHYFETCSGTHCMGVAFSRGGGLSAQIAAILCCSHTGLGSKEMNSITYAGLAGVGALPGSHLFGLQTGVTCAGGHRTCYCYLGQV